MLRPRALIAAVLAALLLASACGGGDDATAAPAPASASAPGDHHDDGHDHDHDADPASASTDDLGLGMLSNGHHEEMAYVPLDDAEQAALDRLLQASREVAATYPTLGDAVAAGFKRAGPFSPGLGIHYQAPWLGESLNADGDVDDADARHPMMLIYDGTEPSAEVAGFMYYSVSAEEPEGFPGANDFWHYHTDVCLVPAEDGSDAPLGADRSVDPARCTAMGGTTLEKTQWMVHLWSVPGYEVSQEDGGVFAEVNAKITCPDGTYHQMDVEQMPDHRTNVCRSELE